MYEATFEGSELPDDPRPPHDLISPSAGEEGMGEQKGEDLRPPTWHEMGIGTAQVRDQILRFGITPKTSHSTTLVADPAL